VTLAATSAMSGRSHAKRDRNRKLLAVGADTGQVTRDALVEADDPLGELVHGGDQSQPHGGHDQGVFHQVLSMLVADQFYCECSYCGYSYCEFLHRTSRIP